MKENTVSETEHVVMAVLGDLAAARGLDSQAPPVEILASSLDQMRLLVGIEDRLGIVLEVGDAFPFDLTSREALVRSVDDLFTTGSS